MTFDPFKDFETRGYLRNFQSCKDLSIVKASENIGFQTNLSTALNTFKNIKFIEYKHILNTHKILFGDVYPWAGQDRLETAPNSSISKGGYEGMFANPVDIKRAAEYALRLAQEPSYLCDRPGEILGLLAHAHPFLDGNGRTIMTIYTELAHRAGISIDWANTNKTAYLTALTNELYRPNERYLDIYLKPFINHKVARSEYFSVLQALLEYRTSD